MTDIAKQYPNFNLERFLHEKFDDVKTNDSGDHIEFSVNYPCCHERGEPTPDTRKKLWINASTGFFHCYRCSWDGALISLVRKALNVDFTKAIKALKGDEVSQLEVLNLKLYIEPRDLDKGEDELPEVELPYGYNPIHEPHEYLEERGVPLKYAINNEWGYSDAGFTKNRIIVPFYMENRLVFWQARATWSEPKNKDFKKVLNPVGLSVKSGILYNYDRAKEYKKIVITEGFMDAVKVGSDAVATNGKNLHERQCEWLQKTNAKEIVLMWDRDAWTDGTRKKDKLCSIERATRLLRSYNFIVKAVKMPEGRDPGSYKYKSKILREMIVSAREPSFK